uniref:Uncharacterized protein n=1 Tax=Meloidogyne incognita TaxID=6306 RepID=A0A914MSZ0_MELIC
MSQLKALKTITTLSLFSNDIQNIVDQLSALSVMSFGPIVACSTLAKDKVVRTKKTPIRPSLDSVHCPRLQVNKNSTRDILSTYKVNLLKTSKLKKTISLIVVDIHPLKLQRRISLVRAIRLNSMLIRDDLPELKNFRN